MFESIFYLLYANYDGLIDVSPFPYWNDEQFDLEKFCDDECLAEFRFLKNDIYNLADIMRLPDILTCYNGVKVDRIEGMCIFLKRFAYPCRYLDMIPRFARPVPCKISNLVMYHIYTTWNHLLSTFNQEWLSIQNLIKFSDAVYQKSGAIDNCFSFSTRKKTKSAQQ